MSVELTRTRAKDIPAGQPRPHPRVKLTFQKKTGRELPTFVYPHEVVNVRSKKDLEAALEHFSHPFPGLGGSSHPKNPHAMRYMVEWVFPALRWFCKVYSVAVPKWLEGKGWAEGMDVADHKRIFGNDKPLRVKDWKEDAAQAGVRM
jgi:hypothetical protein